MSKSLIITPPLSNQTAKKAKKRINSGQKGGSFERLIARQLSLWYSKNESDCIFYRTAASGGRAMKPNDVTASYGAFPICGQHLVKQDRAG